MSVVVVDGPALDLLAAGLRRTAVQCADRTAVTVAALAALGPLGRCPSAMVELRSAAGERERVVDRLRSLAAVVAAVAAAWTRTEQAVAASWAHVGQPAGGLTAGVEGRGGLLDLLARLSPDALEALLVAAPELARAVVEGPGPAAGTTVGADAALLTAAVAAAAPRAPEPRARAVAALLARVPPRRRRVLALLRPTLLSEVRSAPPQDRVAACRVLVAADLARLLRLLAGAPPGRRRNRLLRDVAQRRHWLHGGVPLRDRSGRTVLEPHRLLRFDPRGDGQVVEVVGDLRRARHLAVFVPGTGSDFHRYPGTLRRVRRFAAADPALAVVLWQGADFPDQPFDDGVLPLREHVLAAAYRDAADRAGPALAADVLGLRIAAPVPARDLSVVGHSYGGSIVGSAEVHGMVVDRVVHVGSAGAYADDVSRYAAPPGRTQRFSLTTYDDPIRLSQGYDLDDTAARVRAFTPRWLHPVDPLLGALGARAARALAEDPSQVGHGADPDLLPGVVRLDPGRHDDGRLVRGHSGMFSADSTAWRNLLATMDAGRVSVLEPQRWSSHLEPAAVGRWPRYVVDRTPWSDPGYRPPVLDLAPSHPGLGP